jgi:hypothetical protein
VFLIQKSQKCCNCNCAPSVGNTRATWYCTTYLCHADPKRHGARRLVYVALKLVSNHFQWAEKKCRSISSQQKKVSIHFQFCQKKGIFCRSISCWSCRPISCWCCRSISSSCVYPFQSPPRGRRRQVIIFEFVTKENDILRKNMVLFQKKHSFSNFHIPTGKLVFTWWVILKTSMWLTCAQGWSCFGFTSWVQ